MPLTMTAATDTESIARLVPNPRFPISNCESGKHAKRHTNDSCSANFERSVTTYGTEVFANDMASCAELVMNVGRGHEAHGRQNEVLVVD